jgi:hypothetical protein
VTDDQLLKLMLHHILEDPHENPALRAQRRHLIEYEMRLRKERSVPYQTIVQVDQVVLIGVGQCGQGDDQRTVQSSFEVKKGDQLLVYRGGL